ncbi:MAG: hypothetical protein ACI4RV_07965 [Eubacteriales bacterium]
MNQNYRKSADEVKTNARIRWLPDANGVYQPYELVAFERPTFLPDGWETSGGKKPRSVVADELDEDGAQSADNRRKSYNRARNKLFDLLMCTTAFDSFVTLTFDAAQIDRYDYNEVVRRVGTWLDNRVRRNGLVYALVPELHKDGAVHMHGLVNGCALRTERARSAKSGRLLYDKSGRPIYNVCDFALGYTTLIPLSGDNARIAAAKYCYKYITKTHGDKVGGRYYLSGGDLGRPRYTYVDVDYDMVDGVEYVIGEGVTRVKKRKL